MHLQLVDGLPAVERPRDEGALARTILVPRERYHHPSVVVPYAHLLPVEVHPQRPGVRAKALAEGTGLSVSDLVRLLLQLPAGDAAAQRTVVLDLAIANRLYRELNHWGYQRNQAAHALNRIAYYLRRNDMDAADVLDALAQTKDALDTVRRATGPLASSVRSVAESRILFL